MRDSFDTVVWMCGARKFSAAVVWSVGRNATGLFCVGTLNLNSVMVNEVASSDKSQQGLRKQEQILSALSKYLV